MAAGGRSAAEIVGAQRAQAAAVFIGRVVALDTATTGSVYAVVRPDRMLKGADAAEVRVRIREHATGPVMCPVTFKVGASYLVFAARRGPSEFDASRCGGTLPLAQAQWKLRLLEAPEKREPEA